MDQEEQFCFSGKTLLMYILGLSCFYHDSAACILKDGEILAACQEERFSRIKHDWRFPRKSILFCLDYAGIDIRDIEAVAFYEKPLLKFERVIETFLSCSPRGYQAFVDTIPSWLKLKLWLPHLIEKQLGFKGRILYSEHHEAHAASSFFSSPFEESALLTVDGVGEWATASYGWARGNKVNLTHEMLFPHSLGLLFSALTAFLGFKVNNDEYKVMGMAPYGKPEYYDLFLKQLISLRDDGSLALNLDYFSFQYGKEMFNSKKFTDLFCISPRRAGSEITQTHFNIASSLQKILETVLLKMANHVRSETGMERLCMSGGVALNCVANGRLMREGPFRDIFIQPAAGDAGGALGAAYAAYHMYYGKIDRHPLRTLSLGPSYPPAEISTVLANSALPYQALDEATLIREAAGLLARGRILGWFQGRMEFGPRALGNRSIFADPRNPEIKNLINQKVKFRESFRPFAPVIPLESTRDFFSLDRPSPYMLITVPVHSDKIPAVTHVDRSARVQTVDRDNNPHLYSLLRAFEDISGVPVLLNTSLNIKGEPIAMSPSDALRCFQGSQMDALVLENILLIK